MAAASSLLDGETLCSSLTEPQAAAVAAVRLSHAHVWLKPSPQSVSPYRKISYLLRASASYREREGDRQRESGPQATSAHAHIVHSSYTR